MMDVRLHKAVDVSDKEGVVEAVELTTVFSVEVLNRVFLLAGIQHPSSLSIHVRSTVIAEKTGVTIRIIPGESSPPSNVTVAVIVSIVLHKSEQVVGDWAEQVRAVTKAAHPFVALSFHRWPETNSVPLHHLAVFDIFEPSPGGSDAICWVPIFALHVKEGNLRSACRKRFLSLFIEVSCMQNNDVVLLPVVVILVQKSDRVP
mmetsp:Transcript_15606/g.31631  ORF Transcript_15606/g.31631 Transcript_15606/m.31631 type:complete len:203 (-) Transcript_15606:2239-2847(-)